MNIPRPSTFTRSSTNDPYNLRNGRNSTTSLSRYSPPPLGLASRNPIPPFAPGSYDQYRYTYPVPPLRAYGPPAPPYPVRPYPPPPLGLAPNIFTPLGGASQLTPYRSSRLFQGNPYYGCDDALCSHNRERDSDGSIWRPTHLPCTKSTSSCANNKAGNYPGTTKDILVRNHAKVIRASYLQESPKFEADLSKYLDKKNEATIPDHVVDLLLDFINFDDYINNDLVDEVTLCILATNVGAKSVVDRTLDNLKQLKHPSEIDLFPACKITAMILMSSKVDKGLTAWLKKLLEKDDLRLAEEIWNTREFNEIINDRPELEIELLRLLGKYAEPKDEGFRSL